MISERWTAFAIFSALGGLLLLVGANHASPGCTGPVVERCDYVEVAKSAARQSQFHPFDPALGYEIFDEGSSVLVQQSDPFGPGWISHASSVLIDKKSCRPCLVGYARSERYGETVGPMIASQPAEDTAAEAKLLARIKRVEAKYQSSLSQDDRLTAGL